MGEGFEAGAHFIVQDLFLDPILVTAMCSPFGDIVHCEVAAELAEAEADLLVGNTIIKQLVELVADFFGEPGDFAARPALDGRGNGLDSGGGIGEWKEVWGHKAGVGKMAE